MAQRSSKPKEAGPEVASPTAEYNSNQQQFEAKADGVNPVLAGMSSSGDAQKACPASGDPDPTIQPLSRASVPLFTSDAFRIK